MENFKKVLKVLAIISAVVAAIAGIYVAVTKLIEKKNAKDADSRENYVSCSCFDADFISESTVA
ncbi:MAG: hypothetical protein NC122_02635 [Faecalibacterium sp.]|nr:hypothetical protein [Ruminococcus sp.]MCM1391960.1 hypothetical protein [Ruminococcus sp.]MCM1485081.1 hypothetical protein [Faecalibacterium sp.]